ncbi:MAG: CaiB/BaiF CoA transferase family protein [Methyloligellaceae bacterium]
MSQAKPLEHIVVLDISQGIAGPYCGGLFAEYGARVIKVEQPEGDWMRGLGQGVGNMTAAVLTYNRGKEGLAIDVKAPEGKAAVLALAEKVDVFIQSARPGVMDRLGVGYDAVKARNPRIVYVSVSGYGLTGPYSTRPMTDTIAQAQSGLMSVNRGRDGIPHKIDTTIVDAITGLYAFQAASMAVFGPREERQAREIDISLLQSAAAIQAPKIVEYGILGRMPELLNAPAGTYPTKDGWIAITLVKDAGFPPIVQTLGRPELADDPRFKTFDDRRRNIDALIEIMEAELVKETTAVWVEKLGEAGVLSSAIHDYGDWLADENVRAIGAAPPAALPSGETLPFPRTPGGPPLEATAPQIGQHTRTLLAEAGLDEQAIEGLLARGVARDADGAGA